MTLEVENASREPTFMVAEDVVAHGKTISDESGVTCEAQPLSVVTPARVKSGLPLGQTWKRRQQYRAASFILVAIALALAAGSVVTASVVFHHCNTFHYPDSDSSYLYVLVTFLLYIFVLIESVLSIVALIVVFVRLCIDSDGVLLRAPYDHGKFACLCVTVWVLFFFAGYSFAVPIITTATGQHPIEPTVLCIVPGVRMVVLVAFFACLMANRRLC